MLNREYAAKTQCQEAFDAVSRFETSHGLVLQNMALPYLQQRTQLISSMLEKGTQLGLKDEVVHDGVLLLDRTMSAAAQVPQEVLPVVSTAAMRLSVAQGEGADAAPSIDSLAEMSGITPDSLNEMEWRIRQLLRDDTMAISTMRCLKVYLERMGYRYGVGA